MKQLCGRTTTNRFIKSRNIPASSQCLEITRLRNSAIHFEWELRQRPSVRGDVSLDISKYDYVYLILHIKFMFICPNPNL